MAEFKGKVIEAYFSNNDKDTICIMWRNGEELNEFYIPVDPDAYYFKTLIEEIPLEEIEEHTQKRAKVYMEEIKRLAKRWSLQEPKDIDQKSIDKIVNQRIENVITKFDPKDKIQSELLFRIKLRLFDVDDVKNSKNTDGKSMLRKAENPLDAILAYAEIIGKLGKKVRK